MRVAAIVPCFRVRRHIVKVVQGLLPFVDAVYVVDDLCPESSGQLVEESCLAPNVKVLYHSVNQGVGGAVASGYRAAEKDGYDIFVKVDGDDQMDAALIPHLIAPIQKFEADYTKGNRFYRLGDLAEMPKLRLLGNAVLSFVTKASSGYWGIMDPTNGFTALHRAAFAQIQVDKIAKRYFFESDMLFRLAINQAVVKDVSMQAHYGDESSNLRIGHVALTFPFLHARNFFKRFAYCYLLRDVNIGTIETIVGTMLFVFGFFFGALKWIEYGQTMETAPLGTIMVAALPIILGTQFILAALSFDISNVPSETISSKAAHSPHGTDKTALR